MRPVIPNKRGIIALAAGALVMAVAAAGFALTRHQPAPATAASDYLPKDVSYSPAASPLASAPPEAPLISAAVSIDLAEGSVVGPDTTIRGTANSPDGTVSYRISDYRAGQIAAGQVTVTPGSPQPYQFTPEFSRPYTAGDPATLDISVTGPGGVEQLTRITVKLK